MKQIVYFFGVFALIIFAATIYRKMTKVTDPIETPVTEPVEVKPRTVQQILEIKNSPIIDMTKVDLPRITPSVNM